MWSRPSIARWSASHQAKNLGFIDLNPVLFDKKGNVRMELFLPDELHFRPESTAYAEFAAVVKPILTKAWESRHPYAVSSDGQRFLVNVAADEGTASPITLILNWSPKAGK